MLLRVKHYTALEVRRRFGAILDEASRGERIVIERAGRPIAGIVPLEDLEPHDPGQVKERRLAALRRIRYEAEQLRTRYGPWEKDAATIIREQRDERAEHIRRVLREPRGT